MALIDKRAAGTDPRIMACIRGESGSGKTYLLGQLFAIQDACPVLWVDVDDSSETILVEPFCAKFGIPEPLPGRVLGVDRVEDIEDVIKKIANGSSQLKPRSVVIDNLTELQSRYLGELMDSTSGHGRVSPELESREDFRKAQNFVLRLLRMCRYQLKCDVYLTADERLVEDSATGTAKLRIGLTPALASGANRLFSVVAQLSVNARGVRVLRTQTTVSSLGLKDRLQQLPASIEDPKMSDLFRMLHPDQSRALARQQVPA